MNDASILARIESLREEITLMQNQERFYSKRKSHSFEERTAHNRREARLIEIHAELGKLQRRGALRSTHVLASSASLPSQRRRMSASGVVAHTSPPIRLAF